MTPIRLACSFGATLLLLTACASPPSAPVSATPEAAKAPPDAPTPRDELLTHLAGNWSMLRSIRGKTYTCTADATWVLGDRWVRLDLHPAAEPLPPGRLPYEALVMIGYDANAHEYIAHWHDTFGAANGPAGRGKRTGDTVEFCFDDGGESLIWNTYTYDRATDTWKSVIQNQVRGKERTFFCQETFRRR